MSLKPNSAGALLLSTGCIREVHIGQVDASHSDRAKGAAEAFEAVVRPVCYSSCANGSSAVRVLDMKRRSTGHRACEPDAYLSML